VLPASNLTDFPTHIPPTASRLVRARCGRRDASPGGAPARAAARAAPPARAKPEPQPHQHHTEQREPAAARGRV